MAAILVIAFSSSAPGEVEASSGDTGAQRVLAARASGAGISEREPLGAGSSSVAPHTGGSTPSRSDHCPDHRRGLGFYRQRHADWLEKRGVQASPQGRTPRNCQDAKFLAKLWRTRASAARESYWAWFKRMANDAILSIRYVFREYAVQALVVADCESGLSRHATNGQYLGLFQMGSSERSTYGHGDTFLAQARAAHRYFVASGRDWSPWSCRP